MFFPNGAGLPFLQGYFFIYKIDVPFIKKAILIKIVLFPEVKPKKVRDQFSLGTIASPLMLSRTSGILTLFQSQSSFSRSDVVMYVILCDEL